MFCSFFSSASFEKGSLAAVTNPDALQSYTPCGALSGVEKVLTDSAQRDCLRRGRREHRLIHGRRGQDAERPEHPTAYVPLPQPPIQRARNTDSVAQAPSRSSSAPTPISSRSKPLYKASPPPFLPARLDGAQATSRLDGFLCVCLDYVGSRRRVHFVRYLYQELEIQIQCPRKAEPRRAVRGTCRS